MGFFLLLSIFMFLYGQITGINTAGIGYPEVLIADQSRYSYTETKLDFQNSTLTIKSESPKFILVCNASYPIEWIAHYPKDDDGTGEETNMAETFRYVTDFHSPNTYKYSATWSLGYTQELHSFANFSCKSVSNPELQTHVLTTIGKHESEVHLEITSNKKYNFVEDKSRIPASCSLIASVSRYFNYESGTETLCWNCISASRDIKEYGFGWPECYTPIDCNSIANRRSQRKACMQILGHDEEETGKNCGSVRHHVLREYNPRVFQCFTHPNHTSILTQPYYFGIARSEKKQPRIYFDWTEMDPREMLYIHPIPDELYQDQNLTITCEMSWYYFSKGSWFGIHGESKIPFYFQAGDKAVENQSWKGSFQSSFNITLDGRSPGVVYCFAPVWNSTEWVNASIDLSFLKHKKLEIGESPRITSLELDYDSPFVLGERGRYLECSFSGNPPPTVTWILPNGDEIKEEADEKISFSTLYDINPNSSAKYTCVVTSSLGQDSMSFNVHPTTDTTTTDITTTDITTPDITTTDITTIDITTADITTPDIATTHVSTIGVKSFFTATPSTSDSNTKRAWIIGGSCLFVVFVLVTIIFARLWKILKNQRKVLRILTDAEVKEFMEGNPEVLSKNDNYDKNIIIDAIPYNKKFEIPPEMLQIDFNSLLGSGAFGKVYKGLIYEGNYSHYLNLQKLLKGSPSEPKREGLEVAVKTCDPNVDVLYFKALLSEIKIMAHLGHHKNIVSLVGACTKNIRNREVFIAVEFCAKGGLDAYLRKHKNNFQNKVQCGIVIEVGEEASGSGLEARGYLPHGHCNPVIQSGPCPLMEISTDDLFKWTYEIASGMEYLQNKKVIHGDLATRNVLLTEENVAKIGDFGLARQLMECSNYIKTTESPLPWRYLAPESLKDLEFSLKSDVWGFAVTIWELFTLSDVPYAGETWSKEFVSSIEQGLRLSKPIFATNEMYELLLKCWEINPENRPDFEEIRNACVLLKCYRNDSSCS